MMKKLGIRMNYDKSIKRKASSLKVRVILVLIALIVPLNILSLAVSMIMIRDARASIVDSIRSSIQTYAENIDQIVYNTNSLLYEINEKNTDFLTMQNNEDTLEYQIAKNSLGQTILNRQILNPVADYFYFYQSNLEDLCVIPHNTRMFDEFLCANEYFTKDLLVHSQWHLVEIGEKNYLTKIMSNGVLYYGAFIELDAIMESITNFLDYPVREIIYSENEPYKLEPLENEKILVASAKCSRTGLCLNLTFESSILTSSISSWRWFLFGSIGMYFVLVPLLYHYIKKWILQPLAELNQAHRHLEQGEENYRITVESDTTEFEQAYASFNDMAEGLQTLRLEKINHELARKQMLLDNLQLQIRPHFLLNAFNLLYSMIQTKKTKPAQEMILYLSQYFRYLFRYNRDLELFSKEWDLIQQYLRVSQFQYPNAFVFQYELDPEISIVRIPPLLLHNFFENIMSHALVHGRLVHIMFSGFYDDGIVTFQIADDGRGMEQSEVDLINSGNYEEYHRGYHIGLRNSITRIRYFYNQQGKIQVESTPDEGTIFTITFPYNLEEAEDETIDGQ